MSFGMPPRPTRSEESTNTKRSKDVKQYFIELWDNVQQCSRIIYINAYSARDAEVQVKYEMFNNERIYKIKPTESVPVRTKKIERMIKEILKEIQNINEI